MQEKNSRTSRDAETREAGERKKAWRPPSLLPTPRARPGIQYRWIRTSALGQSDNKNVSARFREGWEPVRAADHPELMLTTDKDSRFPDSLEVGGLLLCQTAKEIVDQRNDYYANRADEQLKSVDTSYLRENDPRMPMLRPERRTRTELGRKMPESETPE